MNSTVWYWTSRRALPRAPHAPAIQLLFEVSVLRCVIEWAWRMPVLGISTSRGNS